MLVFLGIPIFFLELSLGQFTSRGPFSCWSFSPIFTGLGYAMFIISAVLGIYYNIIIAWSIYYMFDSFRSELPWAKCDPKWSTPNCMDYLPRFTIDECEEKQYSLNASAGICTNGTNIAIFDRELAKTFGIVPKLPSQEYLDRYVLQSDFSDGIENLGPLQSNLVLCYLVAFILVIASLYKSIKSSGKVVYFTATFPYVILLILLIRGLMLDGHEKGIEFYTNPDLSKLTDSAVWKEAAVQIFFSLSASYGGLIALASYNKFHTNTFRDAILVSLVNCLTSVFAGFVIFSYLGNLAKNLDVEVDEVAENSITLAFVVYPYAVTQMPGAPFWSVMFFLMLITLGVDSEFVLVETVMTCLSDKFPKIRQYKLLTVSICSLVMFLLGLVLATKGGLHMLSWMDKYAGGWNLLFVALCECIAIGYVYGARRFLKDIECMIGKRVIWDVFPWSIVQYWWIACWCVLSPVGLVFIICYSWYDYTSLTDDGQSPLADIFGWLLTTTVLLAIVGTAVYKMIYNASGTVLERLKKVSSPLDSWGPDLPQHKALVRGYKCAFNKISGESQNRDKNNGVIINMEVLGLHDHTFDRGTKIIREDERTDYIGHRNHAYENDSMTESGKEKVMSVLQNQATKKEKENCEKDETNTNEQQSGQQNQDTENEKGKEEGGRIIDQKLQNEALTGGQQNQASENEKGRGEERETSANELQNEPVTNSDQNQPTRNETENVQEKETSANQLQKQAIDGVEEADGQTAQTTVNENKQEQEQDNDKEQKS